MTPLNKTQSQIIPTNIHETNHTINNHRENKMHETNVVDESHHLAKKENPKFHFNINHPQNHDPRFSSTK